jgi:hypothetical protein
MNILYIGQYTNGTTSKMRADQLKKILSSTTTLNPTPNTFNPTPSTLNPTPNTPPHTSFHIIDTHIPFHQTHRVWRSLGFRYKRGPLISNINTYIIKKLDSLLEKGNNSLFANKKNAHQLTSSFSNSLFTLIWIDKAIFLTPKTTQYLKSLTNKLVHFTPDPAFTFHKSHLFRESLSIYDYAITTKKYELNYFGNYLKRNQVIYATQGFDKKLHQPITEFKNKKEGILFIGHHEREREIVFQKLIDAKIHLSIAGIKWEAFAERNKNNPNLHYLGSGIYGDDYVKFLSAYQFSWGSVSKWIPELHTTRTFEIPACGTALITERNEETQSFFNDEEAIFYDTVDDMIKKIQYYQNHLDELEVLTSKGTQRVHKDGRDYESILRRVLEEIGR